MRYLFLLPFLLLTACDPALQQTCRVNLSELEVEKIRAMTALCAREHSPPAPPAQTLNQQIAEGAANARMPVGEFLKSDAGRYFVNRQYWDAVWPKIVGIILILLVWIGVLYIFRLFSKTAVKVDTRPVLFGLWQRKVVVEWKEHAIDSGFVALLLLGSTAYSAAIYFAVIA